MSKRPPKERRETPEQTPVVALVPQAHGGALRRGGNNGGGRPPEAHRRRFREALEEADGLGLFVRVVKGEETEEQVVTVGSGRDARTEVVQVRPRLRDRLYAAALLVEHGYGKAPQKLEVEAGAPEMTWDEAMATLVDLAPKMLRFLPAEQREIVRRRIAVATTGRRVK